MKATKAQTPEINAKALEVALEKEVESAVLQTLNRTIKLTVHAAVQAGVKHALESATKKSMASQPLPQTKAPASAARVVQNGVTAPAPGGRCAAVWDALDAMVAKGKAPMVADIRKVAAAKKWNEHNAEIEFYNWRKFHGVAGKPAAPAVATPPQRRSTDRIAA